jgi:hypothetical protein
LIEGEWVRFPQPIDTSSKDVAPSEPSFYSQCSSF